MFKKKARNRLYLKPKSQWYTKPRRRRLKVRRSTPLFKWKDLKKWAAKSWAWVAVGSVFLAVLLALSFSTYFTIKDVEVVRENFNVDSAAIENELNPFIGKNILFLPRSQLRETIRNQFPEFRDVDVNKVFPDTLKVRLTSYPTVANLRAYYTLPEPEEAVVDEFTELNKAIEELEGSNPNLGLLEENPINRDEVRSAVFDIEEGARDKKSETAEQKFLINRIGQAIFDQEENLELLNITVRGLNQPVEDREIIIPTHHMDQILDTIQYLQNQAGLQVLSLDYLPIAREMHLKTANGLVLWVSIERDTREQVDKLVTIYQTAELNKETLAYIDLRVKNKVIYCPLNSRCDPNR